MLMTEWIQDVDAGNGNGEGTHLSVFLYVMKGKHDDGR